MTFILFTKPQPLRKISKDGSLNVTDEVYATLISAIGALFAIFGTLALVILSIKANNFWHTLSFVVYGLTFINLFMMSTLHHGIDSTPKTEHLLLQLDYYSIYIMIAGTFTPLCLVLLHNNLSITVLIVIWLLAITGITLKVKYPHMPKWISTSFYIVMGWMATIIIYPIYLQSPQSIQLIALGGILYTIGAVIFHFEKPNPIPGKFGFHEIWHLFVVAGAVSHYFVMYFMYLR